MTAALADQHQEPAAGVEILLVGLEMLIEQVDLCGQDRDLHRGRTCVLRVRLKPIDHFDFLLFYDSQLNFLLFILFLVSELYNQPNILSIFIYYRGGFSHLRKVRRDTTVWAGYRESRSGVDIKLISGRRMRD